MTLAPRDYIAERRREISQRIEALKAELTALDRMESAIAEGPLMVAKAERPPAYLDQAGTPLPLRRRRRVEGGIKAVVMELLIGLKPGDGLPAIKILVGLKVIFGIELPRTSLSPQLSRLRKEGMIEVNDAGWSATIKGRESYKKDGP